MSLPAIETVYRHQRFRSRLEAHWAAFFDEIGWHWEYEPFDARHYIPDFVILGKKPLLIEVKPGVCLADLEQHIPRLSRALSGIWGGDVLIVGSVCDLNHDPEPLTVGALGQTMLDENEWAWSEGVWSRCSCPYPVGITSPCNSFRHNPCGYYEGNVNSEDVPEDLEDRWREAGSTVRWH
jgi:hypothetical protein